MVNVYSDPERDPRRHTVSIVYLAHGNFDDAKADDDAKGIGVYSEPDRDPRRHTVSIVYLAHGNFDDAKADDDANDIGVFSFDVLKEKELAFDHAKILSEVKEHLEKTD